MSYTIYVQMKRLGKQRQAEVHPEPVELEAKPKTVRELLIFLVRTQVRQYQERKERGEILPWLTSEEIDRQAAAGKVAFGRHEGNDADEEKAVANALQCFEDGIYRVFLGKTELTELDGELFMEEMHPMEERHPMEEEHSTGEEPVFTFVRLTMLAGW